MLYLYHTIKDMKTTLLIIAFALSSLMTKAQTLTRAERNYWNGFVTYLDSVGLRGSVKLDNHDLSKQLFNQYSKGAVDYTTFVTRVQTDLQAYRAKALQQIKAGKALFNGTDAEFMPGLSVIDGWAGSKTTAYKFPNEVVKVMNGNKVDSLKHNNVYEKQ